MANFLKVLFRNLLDGPSTDPFPFGETFTPERLRGKVVIDPDLCVGCGVCKNSCAAGAIDITRKPDKSGHTITVWRNSCCLCASCRHYCPTGAIKLTNDWHHAHEQSEKYDCVEQHTINYEKCANCGEYIRPLPPKLAEKLLGKMKNIDPEKIRHLCSKCRRIEEAKRNNESIKEEKAKELADNSAKGEEINVAKPEAAVKAPVAAEKAETAAENKVADEPKAEAGNKDKVAAKEKVNAEVKAPDVEQKADSQAEAKPEPANEANKEA